MNGKGCAGSIASGVNNGKILWRKWSSIQARSDLVTSRPSTSTMPTAARILYRSRQIACWSLASLETVSLIMHELLGRTKPVGTALGDALAHLGLDAGHPDHEEFIKVVGGNRQEPDALQRGMARIDRFLQYPAIEMQPGKLPVDEAFGAAADGRRRRQYSIFLCFYNGLGGIHQVSIHFSSGRGAMALDHVISRLRFNDIDVPV